MLCVDNYFTGSRDHVRDLLDNPRFELLRHDITFPLYIEVDEIYNLACPASPVHYQFDPVADHKDMRTRQASICWVLPNGSKHAFCRHPPAKCTATRKYTPSRKTTGGA